MKIIDSKDSCLLVAKEFYSKDKSELLSSWRVKKLLNEFFIPDSYLFFEDENSVLPIVEKNGVAYFFGGNLPFNDYNLTPSSPDILNFALNTLIERGLRFRLTSIKRDYIDLLDSNLKLFDVPFNQNWTIDNIASFDIDTFVSSQKKKKRDKIKRSFRLLDRFKFLEVSSQEYKKEYLDKVFKLSCENFNKRGRTNCWSKNFYLYSKFFDLFFDSNLRSINKFLVNRETGAIAASYNLVLNDKEIFLSFSNCYDMTLEYIQFLIYIDIIRTSSKIASKIGDHISLNAGRGNFGYKSRVGFEPQPMYAIVKDDAWTIQRDNDIDIENTRLIYGRDFGCFL